MTLTFLAHLFATLFMTGLCWFVQFVHYPLFRSIKLEDFPAYEVKHFRTGFITIPVMIIELITGLILLYQTPSTLLLINMGILGVIGLSTMIFQVPLHLKLRKLATSSSIEKLIQTNWIRTIGWTLRMVILAKLTMH